MIVPSVSDTTVNTRCTPKNAVMPWFHERLSAQMFFNNVDDQPGHMSRKQGAGPSTESDADDRRSTGEFDDVEVVVLSDDVHVVCECDSRDPQVVDLRATP